ncbi:hypothetical protein Tco_0830634 [Tanacetum coccineum]
MEEINNFQQEPDETLYQAWERFKELLMKCPQHYLTKMQRLRRITANTSTIKLSLEEENQESEMKSFHSRIRLRIKCGSKAEIRAETRSLVLEASSSCYSSQFTQKKPSSFRSRSWRHFKSLSLDELRSLDFNLLSDKEYSEKEEEEEQWQKQWSNT